jgi:hypothetical protein
MSKRTLEQKNKLGCGIMAIVTGLCFSVGLAIGSVGDGFQWYDILVPLAGALPIAFGIVVIRSKPHKMVIYHNDFLTGSRDCQQWRPTWRKERRP